MELKTSRLTLRRAREGDLVEINAIMADPAAMRYWSTAPHRDLEQTRAWLSRRIEASAETSEDFLIELDGCVIGEVGADPLPEFGLILHPDHWRRGLGYEASSAVIGHIFATRAVESLMADVDPRNEGSIALMQKLGFRKSGEAVGTYCIAGEWVDSVYFTLDRPSGA
ncbi:MAG: GNAT family N-acetyltransferase [Micropepsaceae bacterium]